MIVNVPSAAGVTGCRKPLLPDNGRAVIRVAAGAAGAVPAADSNTTLPETVAAVQA